MSSVQCSKMWLRWCVCLCVCVCGVCRVSVMLHVCPSMQTSPDTTILPPPDSPPPPMESPPPLPPECLPISSSSPHGESSNPGPVPKFTPGPGNQQGNIFSQLSLGVKKMSAAKAAPSVKLSEPSPVEGGKRGMLFSDSFDEYDGDESFV